MVGTVKTTEAWLLYRPGAVQKNLRLTVLGPGNQVVATNDSSATANDDYVVKFHVAGLKASTVYTYRIDDLSGGAPVQLLGPEDGLHFKTRLPAGTKGIVTTAFVSCANNTTEPVWQRIGILKPDQVIFGGDTPYVDVADLATIRTKHRAFLETPFLSSLIRGTSAVGIWDDHDFGLNNGNGVTCADRRDSTRKAFVEYRAHDQYGNGSEALYHKVDLGAMEIFLLDPRWYSQTVASPVDPAKKTAFGSEQIEWIKASLLASRAPFKVVLIGEVWEDKKNTENDDMFTYWYERDHLLDFMKEKQIPGVVLVGGDIHVSRYLKHPQRLGYDLNDFVTSPGHTSTIASLDVPHPSLEWSSKEPRQFITFTADTLSNPPVLTARFYLADGTMQKEVTLPYNQLSPKAGKGLGRDLRGWWSFDGDFKNQSVLGARVDAEAVNGASLVADGGLRGGAANLTRATSQYLQVSHNALDDNTAAYTASMWCKPSILPAPGSSERQFLIESTLGGEVSDDAGYGISMGLRAGAADQDINVELYTYTLQPAAAASTAAPIPAQQGPFACQVNRSLLENHWSHLTVSFDSTRLRLYLNGSEIASHVLPIPGPLAETGGFVFGGHRQGTGRNFDGLLDEVALWNRVLTAEEISTLYHGGAPQALPNEVAVIDTDGDTMEDWWEMANGLNPNDPADALSDTDHDGVPAWLERTAGTSPLVDNSTMYQYLKDLSGDAENDLPQIFRHPSLNSLSMQLTLEQSANLSDWSIFPRGPELTGQQSGGEFQFHFNTPVTPAWFFRAGVAALNP